METEAVKKLKPGYHADSVWQKAEPAYDTGAQMRLVIDGMRQDLNAAVFCNTVYLQHGFIPAGDSEEHSLNPVSGFLM